jgi:transcriptional regulator with XRE-family HTH domain
MKTRFNCALLREKTPTTAELVELSTRTGISIHTLLAMWRGGYNRIPHKITLKTLANAIGVKERELLFDNPAL